MILLGFVAPPVSAIAHSANVLDCLIWATIALVVQVIVFFLVKVPVPNLSARISAGEFAPAIWLGSRAVWPLDPRRREPDHGQPLAVSTTCDFVRRVVPGSALSRRPGMTDEITAPQPPSTTAASIRPWGGRSARG